MFGSKQIIERLIASHEAEREAWLKERRALLNRLMAPEVASYEPSGEPSDAPLYVPYDDDEAHADYIEKRRAGEVN